MKQDTIKENQQKVMTTEIGPQKLYILESDRDFKNMDNMFKQIIRLKKSVGNTTCKK